MKKRSTKLLKQALSLAGLVLVVLAARSSLADHYTVPSGSMRPTVEVGDRILVDKLAYGLRLPFSNWYLAEFDGPRAGDVIVFESPEDGTVLLKRVAAVPGDRVEFRGQPLRLPAGQYFMLGDNHANSRDSRFFGPVSRDRILGRATAVWMRNGRLAWHPL